MSNVLFATRQDASLENPDFRPLGRFERAMLPHLDAAYNLARWLTRRHQDAEEVVQEAYLRAFRFFGSFRGSDGRTWLLAIVRNTYYSWLKKNRAPGAMISFDAERHGGASTAQDPKALFVRSEDIQLLRDTLEELAVEFREAIVLHELEGLSYKEIARVVEIPIGTVMSRIARGRVKLKQLLAERANKELS